MNNQEKNTVKKALKRIEHFVKDFEFINYEQYEQLIDSLRSVDSRLPERESRLILNYCSEFLNPSNSIFASCKSPDIAKYTGTDLRGNYVYKAYSVIPGREEEFLARLEKAYITVIENFCELEKMCA